jgi:L-ascorbate metabolism protein UlaG (beta-lactamase superfamily)
LKEDMGMGLNEVIENIKWLGHDGVLIKGDDMVIVIDPFEIEDCEPADLVLISHEHYDHCSPEDVKKIQKDATVIVTEKDSAKKLTGNIEVVKPGDKVTAAGILVEAVPAYNTNKSFHPWRENLSCRGYGPDPRDGFLGSRCCAPAGFRDLCDDGRGSC